MPMFLSDEGKKKLMSFIVMKGFGDKKKMGPEKEMDEDEGCDSESGCMFASEKMMKAIKDDDVAKFNEGLTEWFDMRPSESSESYSEEEES